MTTETTAADMPTAEASADIDDLDLTAQIRDVVAQIRDAAGRLEELLAAATRQTGIQPLALRRDLTARELELLELTAAGLTKQQIADRTGVTVQAVKSASHALYGLLRARNGPHAVALTIRAGLLSSPRLPQPNDH